MSESTAERLRKQFGPAADADAAIEALLVEACRIADRLDRIHEIETRKVDWFELLRFRTRTDAEDEITVTIDNVIGEARQQANTLRAIVATLMQAKPAAGAVRLPAKNPLDELKLRRDQRKA